MILFVPKKHPTKGGLLQDPEAHIDNIGSQKLSIKFNERFSGKGCDKHRLVDSTLVVDLSKLKSELIKIESYCCTQFKEEILDLIVQNIDPYSNGQLQ